MNETSLIGIDIMNKNIFLIVLFLIVYKSTTLFRYEKAGILLTVLFVLFQSVLSDRMAKSFTKQEQSLLKG